jgi:trehalose-phosphatase
MTTDNLGELAERIGQLARVPTLLVACDYDGTVAPLTDDPMEAHPNRDAVTALRSLAEQANTHVTIISGRSLRDLATLSRLPEEIRLVGSHGSEFDLGFGAGLDPGLADLRTAVVDQVRVLGQRYGAFVEEKPTGVTFHFRTMDDAAADAAREELVRGPACLDGVHVRNGHDIMELSVIETNKGRALESLRHQVGASAVLFIGDDMTDEDAFRTLSGPDVGVKVGEARTSAPYRVADPARVAQLLALLSQLRGRWLRGEGLSPIEDHSVLSDLRTAAIVAPDSAVTWLCLPRIDSAAVFAQLLGGRSAGHFTIRGGPDGTEGPVDQRYRKRSLVLETRFRDFTVSDFLDTSDGRTARLAGRSDLHRRLEGQGPVTIEFAPRLDFGRVPSGLEIRPEGVVVRGTTDLLVLRGPEVDWEIVDEGRHRTAVGRVTLERGRPVVLELRSGTGSLQAESRSSEERLSDTTRFWSGWLDQLRLPSLERDLVARSALVLKSLCHGPTGAIVSAATTSLPQALGGVRNWDYRYCWLRDAAMAASALVELGSSSEAMSYLDWVLRLLETRSDPERLAPLYNVTGRHLPPEADITELPGYGGSRPVRVGNAADRQVQLDGFGAVVDLVHRLGQRGAALTGEHWRLVESMVVAVSRRWQEPDQGIWQSRNPPRHHVHSKVMCWLAVDRAITLADRFLDREPSTWIELRERIAAETIDNGWNAAVGSFTAAFDSTDLDASALSVGLSGLLPADDERFRATVAAVEHRLRTGPTVRRYHGDDGLPGQDGGHGLATSWLIDALCLSGRHDDGAALFDELCGLAGHTGLMAEQYDPEADRGLGNVPSLQAHVGLITNALALDGNV